RSRAGAGSSSGAEGSRRRKGPKRSGSGIVLRGADDVANRAETVHAYVLGEPLDDAQGRGGVGERGRADLHRRRTRHEELERVARVRDPTGADDRDGDRLRDLVGDMDRDGPDGRAGETTAARTEDRPALLHV